MKVASCKIKNLFNNLIKTTLHNCSIISLKQSMLLKMRCLLFETFFRDKYKFKDITLIALIVPRKSINLRTYYL